MTLEGDLLTVRNLAPDRVGVLALRAGVALSELTPVQSSLEDAFMALTDDLVEYRAGLPAEGVL